MTINAEEADVIKQVYCWRAEGDSLRRISAKLKERNILAPRGGETWGPETLRKVLANEKYTGNVFLQKTYVKDVLSGKQTINKGQLDQYLVLSNHPSIFSNYFKLIY